MMGAPLRRAAATLLAAALALGCVAARADTALALSKSYAGNVNFVGTQVTIRSKATNTNGNNKNACKVIAASKDVSATLSGIPTGATILSAQLYWAGSGSTPDNTVSIDGVNVSAPAGRRYVSNSGGSGYDFFGGAIEVTAQVVAKRNATYIFSGLTVDNGAPYCPVETVVGGFALLVVYSDPAEQYRLLNLYEGFQYVRNSAVTVTMTNFRTPNPLGTSSARVGHLTWEGDPALGGSEDFTLNGVQLFDSTLNPQHSQFNSTSNINGDNASYGIDFDAYTVGSSALTAGQGSATTTYQSGQDMVLLNAQVIAVPAVPAADLSIVMMRNTALVQNQNARYTMSVSNAGPNPETGPIVVIDTLPAGLSFVSSAGTGWSCGSAGKQVSCSYTGTVASRITLPDLVLTVLVDGSGTLTNSATVGGQGYDINSTNNSASDTAATTSASNYVFTDAACVTGQAFGSAQQPCKQLSGAPIVAGAATPIFVTAVSAGVPTQLSASLDTNVPMRFAFGCANPAANAGVQAHYAGIPLPLCSANGAVPALAGAQWSGSVSLAFKAGAPSAVANASFDYADVGKIKLFMRDSADGIVESVPFVVRPDKLAITSVTRTDGAINPKATSGGGTGFARAGEAFTIKVAAFTTAGAVAPNFGSESEGVLLALDAVRGGDAAAQAAMLYPPQLDGSFTTIVGGVFSGTAFTVDDAGILSVTPRLTTNDYLGAGSPTTSATTIGRFYPDHFDTIIAAALPCLLHMNCPINVSGAAYSSQAFAATVIPMSAGNTQMRNFIGVLARPVTLAAYDQPGGATPNPSSGGLSANSIAVAAMLPYLPIGAMPMYTLPQSFSQAFAPPPPAPPVPPVARNWSAPTPIYLRASASESVAAPNGVSSPINVVISSLRPGGTASTEGGVTVISGRLALENPHGSELQKMPVKAEAQYWAATGRWETSASDQVSTLQSGGVAFANCLQKLIADQSSFVLPGTNCKAVLSVVTPSTLPMKNGVATFWLAPPGAGNNGSAEYQMNNPVWLPSTVSRAVFGVYKASPVIYVREMY